MTTTTNGEFVVHDRRWNLGMHTFLFQGQADPTQLYEKMCRRVAYLKQKMLEDLTEGRKVFVFLDSKLNLEDLQTLHSALKTIGNVSLLHVRGLAAERGGFQSEAGGKIEEVAPNLFVGFLSREGILPSGYWDILFDEWIAICRAVAKRASQKTASMLSTDHG